MPDLYVIAGPNGAGKSTYSAGLIGTGVEAYDGDKELASLEKEYPDVSLAHLEELAFATRFEERMAAAIREGRDFAYETNFASGNAMDIPKQFRKAGYAIKMVFIGLSSETKAMERVIFRVQFGGHDVSPDEVSSRYKEGLKNLEKYAGYFDTARIYHSNSAKEMHAPKLIYELKKGIILRQQQPIPKWARHLPVALQTPSTKNELKRGRGLKK